MKKSASSVSLPWLLLVVLGAASLPALWDVGLFIKGLTPMELFTVDWSTFEYNIFSFGRANLWHMLSMIILEFTAIQLCCMRAFKRDHANSPWILLATSLTRKNRLITPKQYYDLFRENIVQKLVWLLAAFAVVFLSRVNRNPVLLYGGLIVLCSLLAVLWKSRIFWRHKDSTRHYAASGIISFLTISTLAWHFGIMTAIIAYVTTELLLLLLLFLMVKFVPKPNEGAQPAPATPKRLNICLLIDNSGSMDSHERTMERCLRILREKLMAHPLTSLLRICRIDFASRVHSGTFQTPDRLNTDYSAGGGTALYDAIIKGCSELPDADASSIVVPFTDGEDSGGGATQNMAANAIRDYERAGGIVAYINFAANPNIPTYLGITDVLSVAHASEAALNGIFDKLLESIDAALTATAKGEKTTKFFLS
jgi:uncharacterized protein YegL